LKAKIGALAPPLVKVTSATMDPVVPPLPICSVGTPKVGSLTIAVPPV